ncbi:MAG TPA: SDR family NAD(P)-dependent oxidoreductase, partial [Pseudolabrys sp.]|nr:SDR family NAD(P)-dependent oxidoreductase [Pseudolabrys sp.]
MAHDLLATAAAVLTAFYFRFQGAELDQRIHNLEFLLPAFVVYAGVIYLWMGLAYSKWRFTSLPDFYKIARASLILSVSLLILDYVLVAPNLFGEYYFGKITIALYFILQIFYLSAARVVYRQYRDSRTRQKEKDATVSLVLGRAADAEVLLRAIESHAVKMISVAGILSPSLADRYHTVRGKMVLGGISDLERTVNDLRRQNTNVTQIILTPSALAPDANPESAFTVARKLGLTLRRMPSLEGRGERVGLAPLNVEDLLLRPTVQIDYQNLEKFIAGRSVAVTGGGGSIGSEICARVVAFRASRLLVLENSEPALHAVTERLLASAKDTKIEARIADIRDRARISSLLRAFKPDLVFHAAALKHVPILERDCAEAVKTNIFGSVNVADAAIESGAGAMVMISTDKAVEPVSVLGATKRFAEMYCQALDASRLSGAGHDLATRLIAVRFGNVLASNGSVVPKFRSQIEAGGPVTVTHPDMVRYFMTIREASDLVLVASNHALSALKSSIAVYVLNMGQQVKILDLAERLIRLSGFEPNVDIDIEFTGVRPGERLHEQVFAREEENADIGVNGVVAAKPVCPSLDQLRGWLAEFEAAVAHDEPSALFRVLRKAVPGFSE